MSLSDMFITAKPFQSTSSEEDVVSQDIGIIRDIISSFNPRPPKRTLCLQQVNVN